MGQNELIFPTHKNKKIIESKKKPQKTQKQNKKEKQKEKKIPQYHAWLSPSACLCFRDLLFLFFLHFFLSNIDLFELSLFGFH